MDILNIGCGRKFVTPKEGDRIVNHDRVKHCAQVDVAHDLNDLPWPWEDNSFDFIVACAVLEHLRLNLVESLNECWRILRPGGHIHMKLPYWQSDAAHQDPTHYWFFTLGSFDQFDPETKRGRDYAFYTVRKWRIDRPPRLNPEKTSIIVLMEVRK
jgi:SAM-dependent methyltransferase